MQSKEGERRVQTSELQIHKWQGWFRSTQRQSIEEKGERRVQTSELEMAGMVQIYTKDV